jgi:DNA-binding PadR family transcriptional regulator
VSHGTIWTTLERAIRYGLIQKTNEKRPHLYGLTEGGSRRVKWIKGQFKRKVRPVAEGRAVANPPIEKEEE